MFATRVSICRRCTLQLSAVLGASMSGALIAVIVLGVAAVAMTGPVLASPLATSIARAAIGTAHGGLITSVQYRGYRCCYYGRTPVYGYYAPPAYYGPPARYAPSVAYYPPPAVYYPPPVVIYPAPFAYPYYGQLPSFRAAFAPPG
jgi:hypothetical protein